MKKLCMYFLIITSLFTFMAGCTSPKESDTNADTIQTFLKDEFTGPDKELSDAFNQEGAFPPELKEYVKETYKPLVMDWEDLLNKNHILLFHRIAYEKGYQLKPVNIEVKKDQDLAYEYEVKVEYSKDGETDTAKVSGRINLNDDGKIVTNRNMDDGGLLEKLNQ
ncbi:MULTISPECIES: hypothetical protein [Rossellomorea]|uniref:hypothetical protein n=1 Tax=Rossellomorea TaxID=2837508 RepID=UPI000559928E|nr:MULTISPECIES: hypothetical protein [Rossellomorea]UTE76627.1 hypothetical protein M1J35_19035 [Rossellomorea sp. KS-H15a]